ncbi:MAG: glycosyltransferase family 2 protein [Dehalococcoidia bacterium]|jgi:cellulose synthase/poly-beta-1,6-N-acetylglucosamine synthase-like glycosyltransferase
MMAGLIANDLLLAGEAALLGAVAYLALLVVAGALLRKKRPDVAERRRRFAILVPAYNEAQVIARTLVSLADLDYPPDLFEVHVVADNCDDFTAAVARHLTPFVHERDDRTAMGKGQALRWLLDLLPPDRYDAFAVIDADTLVDANFLSAINDRLEAGAVAVQSCYGVISPERSWVASLRAVAFYLLHSARRQGLAGLRASAGLAGNGMAFAAELRQAREWQAFGVTEDLELHARLVEAGVRVAFAPETSVWGEMPDTLAAARGQNLRWERGRLALAREHAPRLLLGAVRSASWPKLAAALDLVVPPLSVVALLAVGFLALSAAFGSFAEVVLAAMTLLLLATYVFGGLAAARVPRRLWLALGFAPVYVLWKGKLYIEALASRGAPSWTRTERAGEAAGVREGGAYVSKE